MTPPRGTGAELERGMAATMGLEAGSDFKYTVVRNKQDTNRHYL
eukprot:SAG31_NODE_32275_length_357_cov_1.763566_1_plen_43_part_01